MQLQTLYNFAHIFSTHKYINYIARAHDNIIEMRLDSTCYCVDLDKSNPYIYVKESSFNTKTYRAPFDIALHKYCCKSSIQSCKLDGMNKILIFECYVKNTYKEKKVFLHLELINRATNAIIVCDGMIISALRFYSLPRVIQPREAFTPLSQPNFTKHLLLEDKELFLHSLRQHYQAMQDALVLQQRDRLLRKLQSKCEKLQNLYDSLPSIKQLETTRDEYIMLANYILTHLSEIAPYSTNLQIANMNYLIPQEKKPSLVSQRLFKQAKKLKQKIQHSNLQKQNLESKITFLRNQMLFVRQASLKELEMLQQKRIEKKNKVKNRFESFYINGIRISMGRNENENICLLQSAKADFFWLHIKDVPSSHLIIHANRVDSDVLVQAGIFLARLCGINDKTVVIDFTKRKFVKIVQGANVVYSKEKTLCVHLDHYHKE
ncbi:DUF814 domain-containing protein [Helicobacter aurati]|uniref:DUF814 domain-containing protein n=1 Tax=Helicobacter aurati TaxID=137778 RepID=A0A3D8J606_9HELI|nr:DUF814 domain-containing protein [Helicobacter aurati]RDU72888.1 DUF814 domain-containing protein [Helicobacter aurati]